MIFVTGPMYSGKGAFVKELLQLSEDEYATKVLCPLTHCVGKLTDLDHMMELCKDYEAIILPEIGSGVIPTEAAQEEMREACGALAQRLAAEADVVVRVMCGVPNVIKGNLDSWQ